MMFNVAIVLIGSTIIIGTMTVEEERLAHLSASCAGRALEVSAATRPLQRLVLPRKMLLRGFVGRLSCEIARCDFAEVLAEGPQVRRAWRSRYIAVVEVLAEVRAASLYPSRT